MDTVGSTSTSGLPADLSALQSSLGGLYAIKRELGRGGMAVVYLADDLRHQREVAIKVLRPELAAAVGVERFLREIHIEATLQHPNILPLHDSGNAGGLPYYVMPYIAGGTLRSRLEREKQLSIPDVVRIAGELADALGYAHARGLVHRDIKPENILLDAEHAVLSDFGIARAVVVAGAERLTGTGISVGTPAYMSPEQGGGSDQVDARSDVYSLGCVVYEMVAGHPPFTGRTAQAVIARHMQDRPPSLSIVRPGLSPRIVKAVERALAKVPADRYPTASSFTDALKKGMELSETTPARWAAFRRPAGVATVVAVGVAAVALGLRLVVPRPAALDPKRVVVFPLRDGGGPSSRQGVGEDVATYIGHVLDGSEPLRWEEGRDRMSAAQRSDPARLSLGAAVAIARDRQARFLIDGSILRGSDSVTVVLRLYDAAGDSLLKRTGRSGPGDASEARLGALGVADLLPVLLAPGRKVDVGPFTNRTPAAIANFLQGERSYRESDFRGALEHYRRALAADSQFALAASKGAQAASWLDQAEEATELSEIALRGETTLPPRFARLARGLSEYQRGAADSAVRYFREALAISPDWSEAWMSLGEVYYHLLPDATPLDSLSHAAFEEAHRNDPDFTPPLFHLAQQALQRDDLAGAKQLISRFRRSATDSTLDLQLDLMLGCVENRLQPADWAAVTPTGYADVLAAAEAFTGSPMHAGCAEIGLRTVLAADDVPASHRFGALFALQNLLVSRARRGEVRSLLGSDNGVKFGGEFFYILNAMVDSSFDADADSVVRKQGWSYADLSTTKLWLLGIWQSHRGDAQQLRPIAATLAAKADSSRVPRDRLFARIITAHRILADGDTAQAIHSLRALVPAATRGELAWSMWEPLGLERLLLAQILFQRGELDASLRAASVLDAPQPVAYLLYLPASLALRARAAEMLDDRRSADRYRARLAALGRGDLLAALP